MLTLLVALIAGLGARDQMLLARLSSERAAPIGVLLVAIVCAVLSSSAAGWAASTMTGLLTAKARLLVVAIALLFASLELLFSRPDPSPSEPTPSLGALALVMLARQLSDATRFVIFAIGLATAEPLLAVIGGVLGSILVLAIGWGGAAQLQLLPLTFSRRTAGLAMIVIAAYLAVRVFGLVGA